MYNSKTVLINNLKKLLKLHDKNQMDIVNDLGYKQSTVNSWFIGKSFPRSEVLESIASYFDVAIADLLQEDHENDLVIKEDSFHYGTPYLMLPIFAKFKTENSLESFDDISGYEIYSPKSHKNAQYFCYKFKGEHMYPDIRNQDLLVFMKCSTAESEDIVLIKINGDEPTVRKIYYTSSGISLNPINSSFNPLYFNNEEIKKIHIIIIGVLQEIRRKV